MMTHFPCLVIICSFVAILGIVFAWTLLFRLARKAHIPLMSRMTEFQWEDYQVMCRNPVEAQELCQKGIPWAYRHNIYPEKVWR